MYKTRMILGGGSGHEDETVILEHPNMAELISYINFQNLILGKPTKYTPFVEVTHKDGSPLTPDELNRLSPEASREAYAERIKEGTPRLTNAPTDPRAGAKNETNVKAFSALQKEIDKRNKLR